MYLDIDEHGILEMSSNTETGLWVRFNVALTRDQIEKLKENCEAYLES
jgi:hypothetical protein